MTRSPSLRRLSSSEEWKLWVKLYRENFPRFELQERVAVYPMPRLNYSGPEQFRKLPVGSLIFLEGDDAVCYVYFESFSHAANVQMRVSEVRDLVPEWAKSLPLRAGKADLDMHRVITHVLIAGETDFSIGEPISGNIDWIN